MDTRRNVKSAAIQYTTSPGFPDLTMTTPEDPYPFRPFKSRRAANYTLTPEIPLQSLQPLMQFHFANTYPRHHRRQDLHHSTKPPLTPSPSLQEISDRANGKTTSNTKPNNYPLPKVLPEPIPPIYLSPERLAEFPRAYAERYHSQRIYCMIFRSLESTGGWIWWEKDWIDVERVERELFEEEEGKEKVVDERNLEMENATQIETGCDGCTTMAVRDAGKVVGDEEEEEVSEEETNRREKYKRIAAEISMCLRRGTGVIED